MDNQLKTALIIEDDSGISALLEQILKAKGITSLHADTLAKTKSFLTKEICPEIIFVDHRLPDGFGFDFISTLRNSYPAARIIAMTAQNTEENKILATKSGSDYFLEKPFSVKQIFDSLDGKG